MLSPAYRIRCLLKPVIKYTLNKAIRFKRMQTVTGNSERLSITIHHAHKLVGTKTMLPTSKTFFCSSREIYNKLIYLIHRQGGRKKRRGPARGIEDAYEMETEDWTMFRKPSQLPQAPGKPGSDSNAAVVNAPVLSSHDGDAVPDIHSEITPAEDR
eukprot:scaffold547567_cov48-Prasinocladus_malaysianus.AAC.2